MLDAKICENPKPDKKVEDLMKSKKNSSIAEPGKEYKHFKKEIYSLVKDNFKNVITLRQT